MSFAYRLEEQCLVRSGLVKLLDRLCSVADEQKQVDIGGDEDEALHRVTSLAWAAFQVLADRCVSWETQDSLVLSSGLAQQVSYMHTHTHTPTYHHIGPLGLYTTD